ncbi:MAG: recombinase family protein [Candidatus Nomurabacteria bacterium]|nr:MAG: recombinase family protein [Candidatus Nomurabacteria bacterium]
MLDENTQPLKYCLYARKSSESDERQAMSIDSQIKEMEALAQREGLNVVKVLKESHSAKDSGRRPVFNQLIREIDKGEYDACLVWDASRLSRCAGDLGSLVDLMDKKKLLQIRTFSQTFTDNPNEKFLLMILCSQAKLENDNRGINVKRGIRAKCEMGWRPGNAPVGYINRSFSGVKDIVVDPDRGHIITELFDKAGKGWSGRQIKRWLDDIKFTNKSGKAVTLSQVYVILNNSFYHGEFEYPEGSGKVYQGAHKPLVSKALFGQIQDTRLIPLKAAWGTKNFAFKEIFKCGSCGASITAEEKFKHLLDGSINRHVYYRCTRKVDPECPEKFMNEKELKEQLLSFIAENTEVIEITDELARKALRHTEIVESALRIRNIDFGQLDPMTEYSTYVLMQGSYKEQGALVEGIKSQFVIRDRTLAVK